MRRLDPKEFDQFANHPALLIEQGGAGDQPPDNGWFFKDPLNTALEDRGGCMAFVNEGGGVYDAHFLFPKPARGPNAVLAGTAMVRWLLTNSDAMLILCRVPVEYYRARLFAKNIGFKHKSFDRAYGDRLVETLTTGRYQCLGSHS